MSAYEFVVSACLAGLNCKYDGGSNPCPATIRLVREGRALPLCPETLGCLPMPRNPVEIVNGRAISRDGIDFTPQFEKGSDMALLKALRSGCKKAILKSRSPSCGSGKIYDGTFSRTLTDGWGFWAAKLKEAGFEIFNEEDFLE